MGISLKMAGQKMPLTLADNVAAQDFASLLPLTLTLKDYAGIEKVSDLPRRLDTGGVPSGYKPSAGDITYYAPWGNLALFYRDFRHAPGLVLLGKVNADLRLLDREEPFDVTLELTD
ncbi:hypothetical protein FF098_008440 [Parvularcula flava]|uniref:Cyclophilin-like domain-containing protein n=1 Tax=Aquisalinus luteolus TaxID=1566827 RepID=A0ABX0HNL8_9PROT|nr:hypothetical protein [Aquisalinus luteolus]